MELVSVGGIFCTKDGCANVCQHFVSFIYAAKLVWADNLKSAICSHDGRGCINHQPVHTIV